MNWTERGVARALTLPGSVFPCRRWTVVPNVYWGWNLRYEADLIAVSKAGYATEIEIKVTKSDLKRDRLKWERDMSRRRGRCAKVLDERIHRFYYAMPVELLECAQEPGVIPEWAGIITVETTKSSRVISKVVRAAQKRSARKCVEAEIVSLMRLGTMRYWAREEVRT